MFVFASNLGSGQGYMPGVGYNYGARQYARVKAAFLFTLKVACALMTASAITGFLTAPSLIRFFIERDPDVIRIGAFALRGMCLVMPLVPLGVVCNMTFQSIGKSLTATFLSTARQGIFFLLGVQITQPLADICTFLYCIPFARRFFRELDAAAPEKHPSR